jgi:general secretion pathway protein N
MAGIEMTPRLLHPLLAGAALLCAATGYIAISHTLAQPAEDSGKAAPAVAPPARPAAPTVAPLSGNPLWTIPLTQLSTTRERPIFSPSRRPPPPPPVVQAYVPPVAPRPPPRPVEPERPNIALVGTVAGETEGIGVFMEQATRNIIRLRVGEDHQGWVLRSVQRREATLEKESATAVLALPAPGGGDVAPQIANSFDPDPPPPGRRPPRR